MDVALLFCCPSVLLAVVLGFFSSLEEAVEDTMPVLCLKMISVDDGGRLLLTSAFQSQPALMPAAAWSTGATWWLLAMMSTITEGCCRSETFYSS